MIDLKFLGLLNFVVLLCFISACGSHNHAEEEYSEEEKKVLKEASEIHNQATKLYEDISSKKEELKKNIKQFEEKDKEKFSQEIEDAKTLLKDFETWESEIIEVPGNEHEHSHEGHHHHHHAPIVEVSVEEMLQIQKEMLANIQKLSERLEEQSKKINDVL